MLLEIYKKLYKTHKKVSEINHQSQSFEGQNVDERAFPPADDSGNSNLPRRRNESSSTGQVSAFQNQSAHLNISETNLITNSIHQQPNISSRRRIKRQTLHDNSNLSRGRNESWGQVSVFKIQSAGQSNFIIK